ncbi:putative oxidoreductase [Rhizodiscina lignyota]|uniref:Oxidoreductase n=1 Tax=Rhizodiscina lignyota TaxID=1504668 RepID=A0A9P4I8N7_9PEZI|nr:putative oxidoreductase [Rhizodiscina lignyota]
MSSTTPDPDYYVKLLAFTKSNHRDVYPAIDPTSPSLSQKGKVVVITGASRGIGRRGFVVSFARAGAKALVLLARSASDLAEAEKEAKAINPSIETLALSVDVADEASVSDAFRAIQEKYGKPDVLVNNAAVLEPLSSILEVDAKKWWYAFELNLRGPFLLTKAFMNLLGPEPTSVPPKSSPTRATIINVTTSGAHTIVPNHSSYCISKLALNQLTAYVAAEDSSITCVCVHPGVIPTDMSSLVPFLNPFAKDSPELVGSVAVWLASGDQRFLSGRYITANWDVEELVRKKDEILDGDKLTTALKGEFGMQQFEKR